MLFLGRGNKTFNRADLCLAMKGINLEAVAKYVYLGPVIDENLTFNDHLNGLISRCFRNYFYCLKLEVTSQKM